MPAFPERESSLLSKLHETAPWTLKLEVEGGPSSSPTQAAFSDLNNSSHNGPAEAVVNIGAPVDALISTGESRMYPQS